MAEKKERDDILQFPSDGITIHPESIRAIVDGVAEWLVVRDEEPVLVALSAVIFQDAVHVAREVHTHFQQGPIVKRFKIVMTLMPNGVWIEYVDREDTKVLLVPLSNVKEMTPAGPPSQMKPEPER